MACGRFDAFWEYGPKSWDMAAGALLIREAGGAITNFDGEKDFLFGVMSLRLMVFYTLFFAP